MEGERTKFSSGLKGSQYIMPKTKIIIIMKHTRSISLMGHDMGPGRMSA